MAEHGPSEKAVNRGTLAVYELQHGRPPADTANGAWLYGESRDKARVPSGGYVDQEALSCEEAANWVERVWEREPERFKPSAPGGDDGH